MRCPHCGTEYGTKTVAENGLVVVTTDQPLCDCEEKDDREDPDELARRQSPGGGDR